MYALLSGQGTACAETALCNRHYADESVRRTVEWDAPRDPTNLILPEDDRPKLGTWTNTGDNDALYCTACGVSHEQEEQDASQAA